MPTCRVVCQAAKWYHSYNDDLRHGRFLQSCIDKYESDIGPKVPLRQYYTPFLPEDHPESPVGAPGAGPVRECPWCFYTGPPQSCVQYPSVDKLPVRRKPKTETSVGSTTGDGKSAQADGKQDADEGALASVACSFFDDGFVSCTASATRPLTIRELPCDQSVEMDVQMRCHDAPTHGIYTSYLASENDRVDW